MSSTTCSRLSLESSLSRSGQMSKYACHFHLSSSNFRATEYADYVTSSNLNHTFFHCLQVSHLTAQCCMCPIHVLHIRLRQFHDSQNDLPLQRSSFLMFRKKRRWRRSFYRSDGVTCAIPVMPCQLGFGASSHHLEKVIAKNFVISPVQYVRVQCSLFCKNAYRF